jgi:predicted transcriptional regulator
VVNDEGRVVGVVSEGDILLKETAGTRRHRGFLAWLTAFDPLEELKLDARTAGEAMTVPAITIGPRRPLTEAATTMVEQGVNRLPVVGDEGKLIGIVTRADLVRAFIRPDAEIAREIRDDVIARTLWISPEAVRVEVEDGEVRLSGTVETRADAELVPMFVQHVPGVVGVLSKLRWSA